MEVNQAINQRRTLKVMADEHQPLAMDLAQEAVFRPVLDELLGLAAQAPFHYTCHRAHQEGELQGLLPWRFYVLEASDCRQLLSHLQEQGIDGGKIMGMLAAAKSLIQVTWLPEPMAGDTKNDTTDLGCLYEPSLKNMEHIAAGSAAIQNLLLAATAKGLANYWSSGGVLRDAETFEYLNIPEQELLLGSIFLFDGESELTQNHEVTLKAGALKEQRGELASWAKYVKF